MSTGLKANVDGSAAIQVGGVDAITLTSAGAASFVTSPMTIQGGSAAAPSLTFSGDTNTGIFSPAADTIAFSEGGVESMRIDASGNLGLGVTPSASEASGVLFLKNNGQIAYAGATAYFDVNIVYNSAADRYITNGFATRYSSLNGQHRWSLAPSGTAGNAITFTQAMTLDASGYLLLNAISSAGVGVTRYQVGSTSSATSQILLQGTSTHLSLYAAAAAEAYVSYAVGSALIFGNGPADGSSFTPRARIDSSGVMSIGTTGTNGGLRFYCLDSAGTSSFVGGFRSTNTSYASSVQVNWCDRSASSAYNFLVTRSTNDTDTEHSLRGDGNAYADGTWNNNGADYAEFFESATGAALTLGATVVLDGNKVREATSQDPASAIMGVVRPKEPSKASMVVGNTAWNKWANKYLTDEFDRYIMEDHDVLEWTDEDGKQHSHESHNIPDGVTVPDDVVVKTHDDKGNKFQHYKLNPAWDKDAEYTPREQRPEWNIIGLIGQVKVLKGQPVNDRWIKMRDVSDTVEEWFIR